MAETAPLQQSMAMPFNEEGAVLDPPLPNSWTLEKLKSGELPVRIFGDLPSPSHQRLRFVLKFYQIPFELTLGAYQKQDKSYPYKKMPVMRVGTKDSVAEAYKNDDPEKGRMINDGYTMMNAFAKILQGSPFNDDEIAVQKLVTFGLQYPCIANAVREGRCSGSTLTKMCPRASCPTMCCAKLCLGCCCPYCCCPCCCNEACCKGGKVTKIFQKDADANGVALTRPFKTQSFMETGVSLASKLGSKQFFHGEEYGLCDVDVFGLLHHNAKKMNLKNATALINADPNLKAWFERMDKIAGHVDHFEGLNIKEGL